MTPNPSEKIVADVLAERARQDLKWGVCHHPSQMWLTILAEEVGEVAKAILLKDTKNYREELVQVAAVALAAIESLDAQHADE
jgi:NTP pyrophosphatase (non-canonical NTP hydrolase)